MMYIYFIINLFLITFIVLSVKCFKSIAQRISMVFLCMLCFMSFNVVYIDNIYINNYEALSNTITAIEANDFTTAKQSMKKLKCDIFGSDNTHGYKLLFNSIIAIKTKQPIKIEKLQAYLENKATQSNVEYNEYFLFKRILNNILVDQMCIQNKCENSSFYVKHNIHGFYNDVAYIQILNHLSHNKQYSQALNLINQLLNGANSRLNKETIEIIQNIHANILCKM